MWFTSPSRKRKSFDIPFVVFSCCSATRMAKAATAKAKAHAQPKRKIKIKVKDSEKLKTMSIRVQQF